MAFIAGAIVGGLIWAIFIYLFLKRRYETEIAKSYSRGYECGSEHEKRAIFEYIELLENKSNKGSEA